VANHGIWRHSTALREYEALFLNGLQRSVNRKVQGSNPWFGAKIEFKVKRTRLGSHRRAPIAHPLSTDWASRSVLDTRRVGTKTHRFWRKRLIVKRGSVVRPDRR